MFGRATIRLGIGPHSSCLGGMVILPPCGLINCANKLDSYGCSGIVTVNCSVFRTGLI